jgi:hypothetical protein
MRPLDEKEQKGEQKEDFDLLILNFCSVFSVFF